MKKLKTHHKIGLSIASFGLVILAISPAIPTVSSYLAIAGIALTIVGGVITSPNFTF